MRNRRVWVMLALFLVLIFCTGPSDATPWTDAIPPVRFQGPAKASVFFMSAAEIRKACADLGTPPAGMEIVACSTQTGPATGIIALPNPCPDAAKDYYAQLVCHEIAHLRGWSKDHEL